MFERGLNASGDQWIYRQFLWTTVLKELEDYIYCERVFTQLFHCTRVRERKARWKFSFVLIASSSAWNWKCENEKKFVCAFPATFPSLFLFLNCAHHTRWSSIKYICEVYEEFCSTNGIEIEFWANKKWKFIYIHFYICLRSILLTIDSYGRTFELKWKTNF